MLPSTTRAFPFSRKDGHIPGFLPEIYSRWSPGSNASTSGSFPTGYVASICMFVRSTHCNLVVALSRYKGPVWRSRPRAIPWRALYSSDGIAPDNLGGCRVQIATSFVLFVDGNEDVAGAQDHRRCCPAPPPERDCGDQRSWSSHRSRHPRLPCSSGDEDSLGTGERRRWAVRIFDWSGPSRWSSAFCISTTATLCSPGWPTRTLCPNPEPPKHHERWGIRRESPQLPVLLRVENNELISVHVGDVETEP